MTEQRSSAAGRLTDWAVDRAPLLVSLGIVLLLVAVVIVVSLLRS